MQVLSNKRVSALGTLTNKHSGGRLVVNKMDKEDPI